MKSVFELKSELYFDEDIFEDMKKKALSLLKNQERGEYTQAIVLRTARGNEYCATIKNALSEECADERALLQILSSNEDTEISRILCMWQDGGVDIPSFRFRKMIYELDSANAESGIFVKTATGYAVFGLENSIK